MQRSEHQNHSALIEKYSNLMNVDNSGKITKGQKIMSGRTNASTTDGQRTMQNFDKLRSSLQNSVVAKKTSTPSNAQLSISNGKNVLVLSQNAILQSGTPRNQPSFGVSPVSRGNRTVVMASSQGMRGKTTAGGQLRQSSDLKHIRASEIQFQKVGLQMGNNSRQ